MRAPTFSSSTTVDSGYSTGKEDTPGFIADRQLQTAVEKGDLAAVKTELNNANGGEEVSVSPTRYLRYISFVPSHLHLMLL